VHQPKLDAGHAAQKEQVRRVLGRVDDDIVPFGGTHCSESSIQIAKDIEKSRLRSAESDRRNAGKKHERDKSITIDGSAIEVNLGKIDLIPTPECLVSDVSPEWAPQKRLAAAAGFVVLDSTAPEMHDLSDCDDSGRRRERPLQERRAASPD